VEIGIGLPTTIAGVAGATVLEWARRADFAGFSTLGTIDRVVYGNYDSVPALAAAAAVTSRIRLTTAILISPYRGNGALLAKQLASVDQLSGGRLVVGVAVGGREDDYAATGSDFARRGAVQDALLAEMRAVWAGEPRGTAGAIGPAPVRPGGPPLLIGGTGAAAIRRTTAVGAGWIAGGGGPAMFADAAGRVREAWAAAGREGAPRLVSLGYYALGPDADDAAHGYLSDYYAFAGPYAEQAARSALIDPEAVRRAVDEFAEAGCDELILFPCSPDLEQVDRLAEAALG
jgi:alkanesulfonate monooxygenase SsuD/methylene tetrahydromethanopterin reductase-like flavin-dependent oxidoreductase (luciferase family)